MSKKMEEFFNLPPVEPDEIVIVDEPVVSKTKEELFAEADKIYNEISTAEKIDFALPVVRDLESHDQEMDIIAEKAMNTFKDLVDLGGNVPDMHAGKIYEVAGQMLKTALDAKNAKAERKLKMIDLQIKKVKAEQNDPDGNAGKKNSNNEFDRNELLKYIVSSVGEKK